jgi:hypothetical protein
MQCKYAMMSEKTASLQLCPCPHALYSSTGHVYTHQALYTAKHETYISSTMQHVHAVRLPAVGYSKRYSKILEYKYRVKNCCIGYSKTILYPFSHSIFRVVQCLFYTGQWWIPLAKQRKKCYNSQNQKSKLNFDCTIKFVLINPSKLDHTWIYLDKVTSESHSG